MEGRIRPTGLLLATYALLHALEFNESCCPGLIFLLESLGRPGFLCMEGRTIKRDLLTIIHETLVQPAHWPRKICPSGYWGL